MTLEERYWIKVDTSGGPDACWPWLGALDRDGYGHFDNQTAHRSSYRLQVGPIPEGLHIDHLCRNRACQNAKHLEAVTKRENELRGLKGVLKTHCPSGHPCNETNTYMHRGRRVCRVCNRAAVARYKRAHGLVKGLTR